MKGVPGIALIAALLGATTLLAAVIWASAARTHRRRVVVFAIAASIGAAGFVLGLVLVGNTPAPAAPAAGQVGIKDLALPLEQFPLPGYRIRQDEPTSSSQVSWEREFGSKSSSEPYAWVNVRLYVITNPTSYVEQGDCSFTPSPGSTMPLTSTPITAVVVGEGTKACKHTFDGGSRTLSLRTATEGMGIFLQAGARPSASDDAAMQLLSSLAQQQIEIVKTSMDAAQPAPESAREAIGRVIGIIGIVTFALLLILALPPLVIIVIVMNARKQPHEGLNVATRIVAGLCAWGLLLVFLGLRLTPEAGAEQPRIVASQADPRVPVALFLEDFNTAKNRLQDDLDALALPDLETEDEQLAIRRVQNFLASGTTLHTTASAAYGRLKPPAEEPLAAALRDDAKRILDKKIELLQAYRTALDPMNNTELERVDREGEALQKEEEDLLPKQIEALLTKYGIKDAEVGYRRPWPLPERLEFTGTLPAVTPIAYQGTEGTVTAPGYAGWVAVVVSANTDKDDIYSLVVAAEASFIAADTTLGLYTVSVTPGTEGAFIQRMRNEPRVVSATPVFAVGPAQQPKPSVVVDFPYVNGMPLTGNTCLDYHGDLTYALIKGQALPATLVNVRAAGDAATVQAGAAAASSPLSADLPTPFLTALRVSDAMAQGSVVNLSIGASPDWKSPALENAAYRQAEGAFLAAIFSAVERSEHDVPVVIAAGNGDAKGAGQDMTRYVEGLRKQFPTAAKRIRIVSATKLDGTRTSWSNYSTAGAISAPGEGIPIDTSALTVLPPGLSGTVRCDGTSFAAPIVTMLTQAMRMVAPDKSANRIWQDFEAVTGGTVPPTFGVGTLIPLLNAARGIYVETFSVSPSTMVLIKGRNNIFRAEAEDQNGNVLDDLPSSAYTWVSSNPAVARVDELGFVDAISAGTASIKVSITSSSPAGPRTLSATVTVTVLDQTTSPNVPPAATPPAFIPPPPASPPPAPPPAATIPASGTMGTPSCRYVGRTGPSDLEFEVTVSGTATGPVNTSISMPGVPGYISGPFYTVSAWTNSGGGRSAVRGAGQPDTTSWTMRIIIGRSPTSAARGDTLSLIVTSPTGARQVVDRTFTCQAP